ncbi:MAG: hypothetical protein ABW352_15900 [Polyangiales bacterium]
MHVAPPSALAERGGLTTLLRTSALVAVTLTLLVELAPSVPHHDGVARCVGILLAIAATLATAWAAPTHGARRGAWFLGLCAVYGSLFVFDLGTLSAESLCLLTLLLLTTAGLVGGYIGSLLEYPGMLLVVSYVAALADCFSLLHPSGLTAQVLRHPKALALLTISVPVLGTSRVQSLIGIGDVAFASLFVAGARTTGLSVARTLGAIAAALALVALSAEVTHATLPALPFLGAAVLLVHPSARRLPRAHTRRIAINLVLVTLILAALLWRAAVRPAEQRAASDGREGPALYLAGQA